MRYNGQTFNFYGRKFRQCNVTTAEKAFNEGKAICMLQCNLLPYNVWERPMLIERERTHTDNFQFLVSEFMYYNCDTERGRYPVYFIEI